jgi:EmrB/QacA subfamily drug resistance transporter
MKRNRLVSKEESAVKSASNKDRRWWAHAVLSLAVLVITLDNTILNVAIPALQRDLGASDSQLQWIVDAYLLVFAGLLLTAGSIGDRFGRRRALFAGLAVFAGGSLAAAFSTDSSMLIASRAVMGIGGAFIMPTTLSIVTNMFDGRDRAKAIGIWAAVAGLGIGAGPVAGGFLLEHFEWGSVFLVNVPVAFTAIAAGWFLIPDSRDPQQAPLDPVGAVLSITGLAALLWGIIEAPSHGWTDPQTLAAFAVATIVLGAFLAWERHTDSPMLDLTVFRNRRFSAASLAITLVFFALMGVMFFLTQYLQMVAGYSALEAGVRTLPIAGGMILAAPLSAKLAERLGTKLVVGTGLGLTATGFFVLSTISGASEYSTLAAALFVTGLGMGAAMAPATDSIMGSLPPAHAGVGSAINDTTRMVGGSLGVAVLGSLLSSGYRGQMESAVSGLPGSVADAAREGIGQTAAIAHQVGGSVGNALLDAGQSAFVDAMSTVSIVAAAVAVAGSALAFALLPAREGEREIEIDPTGAVSRPQPVPA